MPDFTAKITIPDADPAGDGSSVTGVFEFGTGLSYELETRTEQFFQSSGTTAALSSVILDWYGDLTESEKQGDGLRQVLSLDIGGGIHAITTDFTGFEGSSGQWGDSGTGGTVTDATGEDVHVQAAMFDRYLQTARLDSTTAATLELGEYSTDGRFGPLRVIPENPNLRFDSAEQTSVFDGSVTWIETLTLDDALDTRDQDQR